MKAGHTEIFVRDTLKSKEFYTDVLGFELIEVQHGKFVWLKSGELVFLLRPFKANGNSPVSEYNRSNIGIVLYTDNLDMTAEKLKMKGLEFKGTDGSERCLTFTDPDGNWFQLVNPHEH